MIESMTETGEVMTGTRSRDVTHQSSEFRPDLVQKREHSILRATFSQGRQHCVTPAATFAFEIAGAERAKNSLRAATSAVILARPKLLTSQTGIKPERRPFIREARFLDVVLWFEPTDNPAFSLDDCQPHDDRELPGLSGSSLFEPNSTFRLVVLVPYQ